MDAGEWKIAEPSEPARVANPRVDAIKAKIAAYRSTKAEAPPAGRTDLPAGTQGFLAKGDEFERAEIVRRATELRAKADAKKLPPGAAQANVSGFDAINAQPAAAAIPRR